MKALVYRGPGSIRVEDVPEPELRAPDDALVRVTVASICGSDLHILHGKLPGLVPGVVVGHEFTGVVEAVGPAVTGVRPGDRVVGSAAVWCGRCRACRAGLPAYCEKAAVFGCGPRFGDLAGAQAELVRVPWAGHTLTPVPAALSDEQALFAGDIALTAFTACEGMTPGGPGIRQGDTVAVFGAGPVGLCAVAEARLFGAARVLAVDVEDYRLEAALRLGADRAVNASREDPKKAIREASGGWGADFVIEAAGRPETLATGIAAAAPGGVVSVVGVFEGPVEVSLPRMLAKGVSLRTGLGHLGYAPMLLRLIEAGKLDLTALITHRMPLSEGERAYDLFDKRQDGVLKVLLTP